MQFHIDNDDGATISGWVVPDNPALIPEIVISCPGQEEKRIQANVLRPDLKDIGLHSTGMAGFLIDDSIVPGLSGIDEIELRDSATQIPFFRRFRPQHHLPNKLFFYALYTMPQPQIEAAFARHFSLNYSAIEQYSFDTLFSIINNQFANSIFLSGHPRYFRYRQLLKERGFRIVTLLRDPFDELAERLLFVRYASSDKSPAFTAKYLTGLDPLVSLTRNFDFNEPATLAAAFGRLTESQRDTLFNPVLRTISCGLDETPTKKHIPAALEYLSNMDVVGLFNHIEDFRLTLSELFGLNILSEARLSEVSFSNKIAIQLRKIDPVRRLLALDAELFARASEAILKGLSH